MSAMPTPLTNDGHPVPGDYPANADQEEFTLVADGNLRTWPVTKRLLEDAIIIPVMGITGSGKSTLIEKFGAEAEYARDDGLRLPDVGHDMTSKTKEICPYRIYRDCRKIIFVDTPGFSDADMEDAKILAIFATWLSAYKNIAGMIWLQPIDDTKFDRQSARNQKLFEAITGERNLPIVSLVTTKWSNAHGSRAVIGTYKKRESELKERWTHLLNKKAQVLRDDNEDLLNLVLNHSKGESLLALQQELVTNKYSLAQTASGRILSDEFRTDRLEEEIIKMLDQILIDRKNGTPNYLLVSDAQRAYDSYVEKREAQRLLDEWTFDKMVGPWVGIPAAGVGAGTFGIIGLVALDEGLSIGLAIGGTTLTAVAALATAGVAVAVVGGALLYQHVTRKPLPETELDAKVRECLGQQSPMQNEPPPNINMNPSDVFGKTIVGRSRDRLTRPAQYAKHLLELEQELFRRSVVSQCFVSSKGQSVKVNRPGEDPDDAYVIVDGEGIATPKDPSVHITPLPSSPRTFLETMAKVLALREPARPQQSQQLYHLTECCLVAQRTLYNLTRLKEAGFVEDRISVIVADPTRVTIAHLKAIQMQTVHELLNRFIETLVHTAERGQLDHGVLTPACRSFMGLGTLGLQPPSNVVQLVELISLWRSTIHLLDASVLLYAGAHMTGYGQDDTQICVPGHFQIEGGKQYTIARRRLGCLHELLGARVWIIHSSEYDDKLPLTLAVKADTIADIWGPMSVVRADMGKGNAIDASSTDATRKANLGYCLGGGHVLPWDGDASIKLQDGEVYCHWLPDSRTEDPNAEHLRGATKAELSGHETLVIGSLLLMALRVNENCVGPPTREDRRRGMPGNQPLRFQPDSRTEQIQLGFARYAVANVTLNRVYKRKDGTGNTWKEDLLNLWHREDAVVDPSVLSLHYGVEFSRCTENARRVTIGKIIVSEYMERYFETSRNAAMHAEVRSRRHETNILLQLWAEHEDWQPDIIKGVCACLRMLEGTGQTNNNEFLGLYCPVDKSKTGHHRIIPAVSWLKMLTDTFKRACFAVIVDECFTVSWTPGRACQARTTIPKLREKASFQTTLEIATPPAGLVRVADGEWTSDFDDQKLDFRLKDTDGFLRHVGMQRDEVHEMIGFRTKWATPARGLRAILPSSTVVADATEANGESDKPPLRVIIEAE